VPAALPASVLAEPDDALSAEASEVELLAPEVAVPEELPAPADPEAAPDKLPQPTSIDATRSADKERDKSFFIFTPFPGFPHLRLTKQGQHSFLLCRP